ncbi:MAG: NUDIX hydrolase [Oscillospiraceae bacterium]|nr:NUDIX hydrolase [Oscillospiraceae bacterium]
MAHLNETTLQSSVIYDGKIIRVEKDIVKLENGAEAAREVVRHPGGVCILALTDQDEVLFVRQFRYPHSAVTAEIPAGKLEYGEDPETCGRRELLEECGCTASRFTYLGKLFPTPAYDAEVIHMYLAEELVYDKQSLDEDEFLDVERIPLEEAVRTVLADGYPDAKTQVAILKYYAMRMQKKGTV